mmetsp:Transcript_33692/g.78701  ORF Transcript_33692/g.78701 Transcript_33692/m.78701 type:complete len:295 (+) Transcript_33692:44-928(+)
MPLEPRTHRERGARAPQGPRRVARLEEEPTHATVPACACACVHRCVSHRCASRVAAGSTCRGGSRVARRRQRTSRLSGTARPCRCPWSPTRGLAFRRRRSVRRGHKSQQVSGSRRFGMRGAPARPDSLPTLRGIRYAHPCALPTPPPSLFDRRHQSAPHGCRASGFPAYRSESTGGGTATSICPEAPPPLSTPRIVVGDCGGCRDAGNAASRRLRCPPLGESACISGYLRRPDGQPTPLLPTRSRSNAPSLECRLCFRGCCRRRRARGGARGSGGLGCRFASALPPAAAPTSCV